jgi:hypothetical protein
VTTEQLAEADGAADPRAAVAGMLAGSPLAGSAAGGGALSLTAVPPG